LSPNPAFAPANNGIINVTFPAVPNAYRDVRVRVTNVGGPIKKGCSTDNFAIRPAAVTLVTTANASVTPPSASNTPIIAAGAAFTLYATTTTGANYTGTLTLDTGKLTAQITSQDTSQQSGGTVGTLTTGTCTPVTCIPTLPANPSPPSNNAGYTEVGYLYLGAGAFRDDTYTSVDASGDCNSNTSQTNPPVPDNISNVLINGKYGCSVGNQTTVSLGRFVPDHFTVVGAVANACTAGTFTYMGQPFTLSTANVVEARNATNGVTQNYAEAYAPLNTVSFGAENADNGTDLSARLSVSGLPGTWTLGAYTLSSTNVSFSRPVTTAADATWGAFDSLDIGLTVNDGDVTTSPKVSGADLNPAAAGCGAGCTFKKLSGSPLRMRFGMLKLDNAYGSELLNILVPMRALYWNGSSWQTNSADSCTSIPVNALVLGNYKGSLNGTNTGASHLPGSAITLNGGLATFIVTKPAPTAVGSADLAINLGATSGDANCIGAGMTQAPSGANLSWLRGNWCGTAGYVKDPSARLKFGSPKAPFIYLREKY